MASDEGIFDASTSPKFGSWGDCTTWEGFVRHVLRSEYGTWRCFIVVDVALRNYGPPHREVILAIRVEWRILESALIILPDGIRGPRKILDPTQHDRRHLRFHQRR